MGQEPAVRLGKRRGCPTPRCMVVVEGGLQTRAGLSWECWLCVSHSTARGCCSGQSSGPCPGARGWLPGIIHGTATSFFPAQGGEVRARSLLRPAAGLPPARLQPADLGGCHGGQLHQAHAGRALPAAAR